MLARIGIKVLITVFFPNQPSVPRCSMEMTDSVVNMMDLGRKLDPGGCGPEDGGHVEHGHQDKLLSCLFSIRCLCGWEPFVRSKTHSITNEHILLVEKS